MPQPVFRRTLLARQKGDCIAFDIAAQRGRAGRIGQIQPCDRHSADFVAHTRLEITLCRALFPSSTLADAPTWQFFQSFSQKRLPDTVAKNRTSVVPALRSDRAAMLAQASPEGRLASGLQSVRADPDNARRAVSARLAVFEEEIDTALWPRVPSTALAQSSRRQLRKDAIKGLDMFRTFRLHRRTFPSPIANGGSMAIIRCKDHPPKGRTRTYERSVEPVGHPESALVCGSKHCDASGLIWFEVDEAADYADGRRIFDAFSGSAMKMRAR